MRQTIDFKAWLSGPSRPRTSYDLYSLWRASCGKSEGRYYAQYRHGHGGSVGRRIVISGPSDEALLLTSGRAIGAFKIALEGQNVVPLERGVWAEVEEPSPSTVTVKVSPSGSKRFR